MLVGPGVYTGWGDGEGGADTDAASGCTPKGDPRLTSLLHSQVVLFYFLFRPLPRKLICN